MTMPRVCKTPRCDAPLVGRTKHTKYCDECQARRDKESNDRYRARLKEAGVKAWYKTDKEPSINAVATSWYPELTQEEKDERERIAAKKDAEQKAIDKASLAAYDKLRNNTTFDARLAGLHYRQSAWMFHN